MNHLNERGEAHMVNVGHKERTARYAVARAFVSLGPAAQEALRNNPKGDVLATARVAGIMAAKNTAQLIPLCHPLALTHVSVDIEQQPHGLCVRARAETTDRTGVEMEALTAASVAALTLYDMLKATERGIVLESVCLEEKGGGQSGTWRRSSEGTVTA